jgi:hypothetical protein
MKVNDEHFYHGAALMQIAEDDNFTAINPLVLNGWNSRIAFLVNTDIAVYPKYAGAPHGTYGEYVFNFKPENVEELERIAGRYANTFILLVCVAEREVCCLTFEEFRDLYRRWVDQVVDDGKQFTLLVTTPKGRKCRVYVNAPGRRNRRLGDELLRSRRAFPRMLFA